jgi:hypothetical protein
MKRIIFVLFSSVITLGLSPASCPAFFLPVGPPEYQLLYEAARRAEIENDSYYANYNVGPYNLDDIEIETKFPRCWGAADQDYIRVFTWPVEDYRAAKHSRAQAFESIRCGIVAAPIKSVFVYSNFIVDEGMAEDPNYAGKKWRGAAGEMETSFIGYAHPRFEIILGRYASFWGPATSSLVLSSTARPMDAISFRLKWSRLYFTYQLARLDQIDRERDSSSVVENRFFAGHRIDFRLFDNLNIGFFETIIFGGPGRGLELAYANPLIFFHAVQLNRKTDDNTLLGLDICYYLSNRYKFFAQLLVDDYQIDDEDQSDQEPDEIAYSLGFHSLDLLGLFDLKGEYLKIANRTYNQILQRNRYVNRGEIIGDNFGPDGDRVSFSLVKWFSPDKRLALQFIYQRRGEGRVDDLWDQPWMEVEGDYSESFPTGVVEKTLHLGIDFSGFVSDMVFISLNPGIEQIKNFDHTSGDDRTVGFFSARISAVFSTRLKMN